MHTLTAPFPYATHQRDAEVARLEQALATAHGQTDRWQAEYTRTADRLREARAVEVAVEGLKEEKKP